MPRPGDGTPRPVTLIPGDGIGPLVTGAVCQVMEAMHAPVYFDKHDVHGDMTSVPPAVMIYCNMFSCLNCVFFVELKLMACFVSAMLRFGTMMKR